MALAFLVACVVLAGVLCRRWYHSALASQAVADAAALEQYSFSHKFSSPAMGATYDQSIVAKWQQTQNRQAARARARSRKAQAVDNPKVAQIRRRA